MLNQPIGQDGLATSLNFKNQYLLPFTLMALVILVVLSFLASSHDRFPGDHQVSDWIQSWQPSCLDSLMNALTYQGQARPTGAIVALMVVALLLFRKVKEVVIISASPIVVLVLSIVLKALIDRPRPSESLVRVLDEAHNAGFPSGHAMLMVALYGFVMVLVATHVQILWLRRSVYVLLTGLILSTGLSRIYLGAHWLSDVYAGYFIGLVILAAFSFLYFKWLGIRDAETQLASAAEFEAPKSSME